MLLWVDHNIISIFIIWVGKSYELKEIPFAGLESVRERGRFRERIVMARAAGGAEAGGAARVLYVRGLGGGGGWGGRGGGGAGAARGVRVRGAGAGLPGQPGRAAGRRAARGPLLARPLPRARARAAARAAHRPHPHTATEL